MRFSCDDLASRPRKRTRPSSHIRAIASASTSIVPALSVSRDALETTLRSDTPRHSSGRRRRRLRDGLVVAQVAMAVVLLAGAGLLVQSFRHLMEIGPGITANGLLTGDLELGYPLGDTVARALAARRIAERLRAVPNVADASVATTYPFGGPLAFRTLRIPGRVSFDSLKDYTLFAGIDRNYFTTLQVPMLRGRAFTEQDLSRRDVAIVNDAMVKKYFPRVDPIGRRVTISDLPTPLEIIGVVETMRGTALSSNPDPATYVPVAAAGAVDLSVLVRVAHGDAARWYREYNAPWSSRRLARARTGSARSTHYCAILPGHHTRT